jgi:cytochrome c oxidase subunit III
VDGVPADQAHGVPRAYCGGRVAVTPSRDTFFAIYYALTGVHALHVAGGLLAMAYFLGPGSKLWAVNTPQFANRIEATGLYWHFVDLVWILLFPMLSLL